MKDKIFYHLIFWVLYTLLEIYLDFAWLKYQFPKISDLQRFWYAMNGELGYLVVKIPVVYLCLYFVDHPSHYFNFFIKKFVAVLFVILCGVMLHRIYVHDIIYPFIYNQVEGEARFVSIGLFNGFMDLLFVIALAFGAEKSLQKIQIKNQLSEITNQKLDAELRLLKTQINPHFLFNTLNNIYGLSLIKSDQTSEIILKLAKIMRYNIFDSAKNEVPIDKEIENIQDFIDIHKIRHHSLTVEFSHEVDNKLQGISPLILLQFVENAFKHGVSESRFDSFIKIYLSVQNNILFYSVLNSKEENPNKESTKIGLKNIKRQLELLYPNHKLQIHENEKFFEIKLKFCFNKK